MKNYGNVLPLVLGVISYSTSKCEIIKNYVKLCEIMQIYSIVSGKIPGHYLQGLARVTTICSLSSRNIKQFLFRQYSAI